MYGNRIKVLIFIFKSSGRGVRNADADADADADAVKSISTRSFFMTNNFYSSFYYLCILFITCTKMYENE